MESLSNNQAFLDGKKRTSFVVTDAFLRSNGYFLDVDSLEAHTCITDRLTRKVQLRRDS
jgi:prophage maintenance system killer protein